MKTHQLTVRNTLSYALFDFLALAFIYFVPTISHMLNFPLYLIEPMRIAIILALVHTSRSNAFIIALTLPLFSFLVSAHPVFYKMMLISGELLLNVWVFHLLFNRYKNAFAAILSSIIISKVAYYLVKFIIIGFIVKSSDRIIATPIYIQVITTIAFSIYLAVMVRRKQG